MTMMRAITVNCSNSSRKTVITIFTHNGAVPMLTALLLMRLTSQLLSLLLLLLSLLLLSLLLLLLLLPLRCR